MLGTIAIRAAALPRGVARVCAALCAAMLVAAVVPTAALAQEAVQPRISPQQAGNTAVRNDQRVNVSGTAPEGDIQGARLLAMSRDGAVIAEQIVPEVVLNRAGVPGVTNDYLRNDGGELSGQLTLGCRFSQPSGGANDCAPPGVEVVVLQVTVGGESGRSNAVRVDYIRPLISGYEVVTPTRIRVIFSEPVRHPQGDSPSDWEVVNPARVVTAVENPPDADCRAPKEYPEAEHECTRVLVLAQPLPEDAEPTVDYTNTSDAVPQRTAYEDFADNRAFTIGLARLAAADLVRPAAPNIDTIDGKAAGESPTFGSDASPSVRLSNLTAGHTVQLRIAGPGGHSATVEQVVPADSNSVEMAVPTLPEDGEYTLNALAIDINDNRSDETSKTPPRADGARPSARYVLDTIAPQVLTAFRASARTIRVRFTEPVFPPGNAGRWYVGDMPVTAQGSDDERTLTSQTDLDPSADAVVRWEPTSDEPGSTGRYGDRAGNGLAPVAGIPLDALPPLPAPAVTEPAGELYTRASRATIAGTAPAQPDLVAELYERGVEQPRSSTDASDGSWSFDENLDSDRRYEFEVRLRNTATGVASQRVAVPDIVRDTVAPVVDVTSPRPAAVSPSNPTEMRERYGVGDNVSVEWTASDNAPGDSERPDHGAFADIVVAYADGTRRTVAQGLEHQPGQRQTFTYTLTAADLAGQASREMRFEVAVTDLAANRGTDASAPIVLLASLIGYTAVLTEPGVVEARFPVLLIGETLPSEWYVDAAPAQTARKTTRDGVTVVSLTVAQSSDPNATPSVQYQKFFANPAPLRTAEGVEVSPGPRNADDGIIPALEAEPPTGNGQPVDSDSVTFSGSTDETDRPNTVSAFRTDASGVIQGPPVAQTTAGTDGAWTLAVPLQPNAVNRIVVRAIDPSGNLSAQLPNPAFTVTEDSLAPVVSLLSPIGESLVAPLVAIRWETTEANPDFVDLDYRARDEQWREIAHGVADDGSHDWELPEDVRREIFAIRVRSTDRTGKTGEAIASGLRLDFVAPTITKVRTTGAQVVEVTFDEPVALDGSGFEVDGSGVRSVKGSGNKHTLILNRSLRTATPQVTYAGAQVRDVAGNALQPLEVTARRSFAFAVKNLQGQRLGRNRVRLAFTDVRNQPQDLRGYRIFRDGQRIGQLDPDARSFTDREAAGRHRYTVRAVDDRRRLSSVRRVVIRR